MPKTNSDAIRRTLAHYAGDTPDAEAIAQATLSTWREVAVRLSPVIGVRGVDVLLDRSLYLTSRVFPWLAITGEQVESASVLAILRTRLAGSKTNTAKEASYVLLTTFVELLITLIGKSLTERLLSSVWAPPLPTSEKETPS